MQKLLSISEAVAEEITKYYTECDEKEQILLLLLRSDCGIIFVERIVYPPKEVYRISTRNNVSLKPKYLLDKIVEAINDNAAGIILMHNHNSLLPLFSGVDRKANKQFFSFFKNNGIEIIGGSAVYARNRISYVTNSKRLKNRYLIKLCK